MKTVVCFVQTTAARPGKKQMTTEFCVNELGASWRDTTKKRNPTYGEAAQTSALQILLNDCWMEAVEWLADAHGASLQGLVIQIEKGIRIGAEDAGLEPFREQLRLMQDRQKRAWAMAGAGS